MIRRFADWLCIVAAVAPLAGCDSSPSTLDPRSASALNIANLWWFIFALGGLVFIVASLLVLFALWRRRGLTSERPGLEGGERWVVIGGLVIPTLILIAVYVPTLGTLNSSPISSTGEASIVITGHQWWWEVKYLQQNFVTANEIHIPAGRPVSLKLATVDVVHSFWVPQLHGKLDMIPGVSNAIVLDASQPGAYRGQCAEFCGVQHANMAFYVMADEPEQFDRWLAREQQDAAAPTDAIALKGQQVFLRSECPACHNIRGASTRGTLGPDLTHIASRRTLGAGTLKNNRGNLAGWIINAQAIKPNSYMPPMYLSGDDLQALVVYLEGLN